MVACERKPEDELQLSGLKLLQEATMYNDFSTNLVENGTKIKRSKYSHVIGALLPKNFRSAMTPCACVMWPTCDLAAPVKGPTSTDVSPTCSVVFYISYFSHCFAKTPDKELQRGLFWLMVQEGIAHYDGEVMVAGWEGHSESTVDKQSKSSCFYYPPGDFNPFKVGFPTPT